MGVGVALEGVAVTVVFIYFKNSEFMIGLASASSMFVFLFVLCFGKAEIGKNEWVDMHAHRLETLAGKNLEMKVLNVNFLISLNV